MRLRRREDALGADAVIFAKTCPSAEVVAMDACTACMDWARQHVHAPMGSAVRFVAPSRRPPRPP